MAKKKNKISLALACVLVVVLVLSLAIFTACNKDNGNSVPSSASVKFMVRENGIGEYREYTTLTAHNGVVTLPEIAEIPGFSFRAWYTDQECTKKFNENKVTGDITVYAFYDDKLIDLVIIDGDNQTTLTDQKVRELETVAEAKNLEAANKNLIFDSWYINEACTEEYLNTNEATTVYGRFAAKVEFDNGYEVLKSVILNPGETIEKPTDAELIGSKIYMDAEVGLKFVDSSDNTTPFEFANKINANTTIKVLWQTPRLEIVPIENSNDYKVTNVDFTNNGGIDGQVFKEQYRNFPAISIPATYSVKGEDDVVTEHNIVAVSGGFMSEALSAKKVIINEGIKYVSNLNRTYSKLKVEEIILPESLVILEDSICGFESIKSVKLPSKLEVIYDCFWIDESVKTEGYDFITIPKSVNNISQVPANVKFEDGSTFNTDGKFVYNESDAQGLGKTLVSAGQNCVDKNNSLILPTDVQAIQVGALDGLTYDYLLLPASFTKISYNNDRELYPFYLGTRMVATPGSIDETTNFFGDNTIDSTAYTIVDDLNKHKYIKFDAIEFPATMNKQSFCDRKNSYESLDNKVIFVAQVADETPINILIQYKNTMADPIYKVAQISDKLAGQKLTLDEVKAATGFNKLEEPVTVDAISMFGVEYNFDSVIHGNLYLEFEYSYNAKGFTTIENEDGTLTVTGFDATTALDIRSEGAPEAKYLVAIPQSLDGKNIVAIGDNAFENCEGLAQIFIPNTVKTIGKAAFKNASRLEKVVIVGGGLQVVGREAFKYAGAVKDATDKMIANPNLNKGELVITLPLENMVSIEPYAFDTPAIKSISKSEDEKDRIVLDAFSQKSLDLKVNEFYFYDKSCIGIVKITNEGTIINLGTEMPLYEADFVAIAPSAQSTNAYPLGFVVQSGFMVPGQFIRYNVKEGSIQLYNSKIPRLEFTMVSKVEKNAISYIDDHYFTVPEGAKGCKLFAFNKGTKNSDKPYSDVLMTKDDIVASNDVFEAGWLLGQGADDVGTELLDIALAGVEGKGYFPGFMN